MSLPRVPPGPGRPGGFTLVEALIALSVLAVALLLGMALVLQLPRDVRRLDAEREATRALEATLEGLRAGSVPLQDSVLDGFVTGAGSSAAQRLSVSIRVSPTDRPGLYDVLLTARYRVLQADHVKQVESLFWRG